MTGYLGRAVWLERWSEPVFPLCKRCRVWIPSGLCRSLLFSVHLQEHSGSPEPSAHLLVQLRTQNKELITLTRDTALHSNRQIWWNAFVQTAGRVCDTVYFCMYVSVHCLNDLIACEVVWIVKFDFLNHQSECKLVRSKWTFNSLVPYTETIWIKFTIKLLWRIMSIRVVKASSHCWQ